VWERQPNQPNVFWASSVSICRNKSTGGRFGWRLPTIEELLSLAIPNSSGDPVLPSGNPFELSNENDSFWSATTYEPSPALAWNLDVAGSRIPASNKTTFRMDTWCVRGGSGFDGQ